MFCKKRRHVFSTLPTDTLFLSFFFVFTVQTSEKKAFKSSFDFIWHFICNFASYEILD